MKKKIEDILNEYGELVYTCKGTSMMPMLRPQKDVFVIHKIKGKCKENEVVLFKKNNNYVLHRVVEVFDDHYTMLGDNCITYEKNIKDEDILGVLKSFQRDGTIYTVDNLTYKIYVLFLRFFEKIRILYLKVKTKVKRDL